VPSPAAVPPHRTLVIGGARSGKSAHGEHLVAQDGGPVRYIATARRRPDDSDFERRIAAHRARRPGNWTVVESADTALPDLLSAPDVSATLVDDLGTWLTVVIDDAQAWEKSRGTTAAHTDQLTAAVAGYAGRLVIVTPEVGQGVVPATASGRLFRDELGELNQRIAAACDEVVLVVAGLALPLK
jgi:adenosylcobinamide kinase / adenosylcobinamide-phosphate guanylyltransferase